MYIDPVCISFTLVHHDFGKIKLLLKIDEQEPF